MDESDYREHYNAGLKRLYDKDGEIIPMPEWDELSEEQREAIRLFVREAERDIADPWLSDD